MKYEIKYFKNSRKHNFVREFASIQERDTAFNKFKTQGGLAVRFTAREII